MLAGKGLLVSLPAQELNGFAPSGSLFAPEELGDVALHADLRSALDVALEVGTKRRARVMLCTHPEMFTHGESLAWLQTRLGPIRDHLMLSDGRAVKPVAAMRNHLFLYRHGGVRNRGAFARLAHHVPELIANLDSQVNTAVSVRMGTKRITPQPWLLQSRSTPTGKGAGRLYPYLHESSVDASLDRMFEECSAPTVPTKPFRHLSYVPLTESATQDRGVLRQVAALIRHAQTKSGYCVLLGAPHLAGVDGAAAFKAAIEFARAAMPKSTKRPAPVAFVTDLPTSTMLAAWSAASDLVMPESFAYWRHAPHHYAHFKNLAVCGSVGPSERTGLLQLLTEAWGRRPGWM